MDDIGITKGDWIHVAAVQDASEGIKLYVNGEVVAASGDTRVYFRAEDVTAVSLGGSPRSNTPSLDGEIDEVRIWNVARSAEEIRANKDITIYGEQDGLIGYWQFEELQGDVVLDSSGNGRDGTLRGVINLRSCTVLSKGCVEAQNLEKRA